MTMASSPSRSVSFEQAAEIYDATRALSPEAMDAVVLLLAGELRDRGTCLEIGVGTGRIALPLFLAGVPMCGIDISPAMLTKLVDKVGGHHPFPLARADATALPFRDASFGAAVAVHVLHLIPAWQQALAELKRVIEPGGVVLVNLGSWPEVLDEIYERFAQEAGTPTRPVGLDFTGSARLDEEMARLGAGGRALPDVADEQVRRIDDFLRQLEEGVFSITWSLDDQSRRRAAAAVRTWAASRFGDLVQPRLLRQFVKWRAYDLP